MASLPAMLFAAVAGVFVLVLWLVAALALDHHGRRAVAPAACDAIVVLGCRVLADGSPSGHLARRVARAVALWRAGCAPLVVLSGGGVPSEAAVAARRAVEIGLPQEVMVLEEESLSTEENARHCARLGAAEHVVVVTDSYHVLRARWLFRRVFPRVDAVGVVAPRRARVENALREVLAIVWDAVRRSRG